MLNRNNIISQVSCKKNLRFSLNVKGTGITGFILGLTNLFTEKSGLYKR